MVNRDEKRNPYPYPLIVAQSSGARQLLGRACLDEPCGNLARPHEK